MHKFTKGQEVIYIPYNLFDQKNPDGIVRAYYLEEFNDGSGKYFLTNDKAKINIFDQKKYSLPNSWIIINDDYKKIKIYNEKLYNKYLKLIKYLVKHEDGYNSATRFCEIKDDIKKFFTYFGYNSKLFDKLISFPYCVKLRFNLNIILKLLVGVIKRLFFPLVFLIDLVIFIYEEHYAYKEAKRKLIQELQDNNSFIIRASTTEEQRKQSVETKQKIVESSKDVYSKSTVNFFTLIISMLSILIGIIYFSISSSKKDGLIYSLEQDKQNLKTQLEQMQNEINVDRENRLNKTQNEINLAITNDLEYIIQQLQVLEKNKEK
jgi:hypothetical protein